MTESRELSQKRQVMGLGKATGGAAARLREAHTAGAGLLAAMLGASFASADEAADIAAFYPAVSDNVMVTVAAVGDVLLHERLQVQGNSDPDGYHSLWAPLDPWIAGADIAYFNLEGAMAEGIASDGSFVADAPFGPDQWVYGGYPLFNYPPIVGNALVASGFDIAGTANNHAMDRRSVGVIATHDALRALGIQVSGTRTAAGDPMDWAAVTTASGVRIGWVACAHHTNGIPDPDGLVLLCDDAATTDLIRTLLAQGLADGVIVTPHWGEEFETTPSAHQRRLAAAFAEAGAMAVIGSHPHVLQGWERIGSGAGSTLVVYSLGNFISNQQTHPRPITVLLFLGLGRGDGGRLMVTAARYLPAYVDPTRSDGRDRVLRLALPSGDWASKTAFCYAVRLYGLTWLQPQVAPVALSISPAALDPSSAPAAIAACGL